MAQSRSFQEQAEQCRRLARDSTDPALRDSLLGLAKKYTMQAAASEPDAAPAQTAGPDDQGAS